MRGRRYAVIVAVALLASACSGSASGHSKSPSSTGASGTSSSNAKFPAVDQPGVTPTEIRVSGVAATTNPTSERYGTSFDGVQAYFNMVNSRGGIYGRKLVLTNRHDDQLGNNRREVEAILDQDKPFAVLPVTTVLFTGQDLLAKAGIPTFGWNIQDEWSGPPNLFGEVGALCIGGSCADAQLPWVAHKLHRKRVGVLAYNVAQSADCTDGIKASFAKYPTAKIVFLDKSLSFGVTDFSTDIKRMREAKVDFVTTCMDSNGVLGIAREMRQQGMQAVHYMPNAYEHDFMAKNGAFFEGSIVAAEVVPIETKPKFAALQDYIRWMDRGGYQKTENAEVGWINADQFVTGLKEAGPNFTRQKLIDALNREKSFNAGGMVGPVDWTTQHTSKRLPPCIAFMRIHNSQFVPVFAPAGKPFTCFFRPPTDVTAVKPVFMQ